MYHVHHLHTEKEGDNLQNVSQSEIEANQAYGINTGCQRLVKDLTRFLSAVAKMPLHNMSETEKKEVKFPGHAILWQGIYH